MKLGKWHTRLRLLVWSLALGSLGIVSAGNHTIDDADPSITYSTTGWNIRNSSSTCTGCLANPDFGSTNMQSFHDSTQGATADPPYYFQYSFQGTDLYVYGILADIVRTDILFTTNVSVVLTLDGENSTYHHQPNDTNSYEYNVAFFSVHNLTNETHDMRVTLNPNSLLLFDYLIYTTPDSTPSTSNSTKSGISGGAIAGIAIGVVAVFLIVGVLIGFLCYRQRKRQQKGPVVLPMAAYSPSEPLVQPGRPGMPNPSTNSFAAPTTTTGTDVIDENDRFTARGYQIPASFNTPIGVTTSVESSALNSKQRMMRESQRYMGGSSHGVGSDNMDDMSSHTGLDTSSSSAGRSRPYAARNGQPWASPMGSLYPHGVAPMAAPVTPDYASGTGYLSTEAESSTHSDNLPVAPLNPPVRTGTQMSFVTRPGTAPPPYPRSPPPLEDDGPRIPNLTAISEHPGSKH